MIYVMTMVDNFPAVIWSEQEGVDNKTNNVVKILIIGKWSVPALMSYCPDTREYETLEPPVYAP